MFFPKIPTSVRQMVYPEKPSPKQSWRIGTGSHTISREKKFRFSKHPDDGLLQDSAGQSKASEPNSNKVDNDTGNDSSYRNEESAKHVSSTHEQKKKCSHRSESPDVSVTLNKDFVHHPGFQGSTDSTSSTLKYKFGKKKSATRREQSSQPVAFRPKGFGSLYDELEFERRYKKVFDLNKHIHFVHSNFVTGQRIYKRNKLPPIGHIPPNLGDPASGEDIFAIMSVQKFNHPDGRGEIREREASPAQDSHRHKQRHQTTDENHSKQSGKHAKESAHELILPAGFVPESRKNGYSPFEGVKGNIMQKETNYRLPVSSREGDSALGTLTEESAHAGGDDFTNARSEGSIKTQKDIKIKITDDSKCKSNRKKKRRSKEPETPDSNLENTVEDTPFNISVHVEIKPKDTTVNGGDDVENEKARRRHFAVEEQLPATKLSETGESKSYPANLCNGNDVLENGGMSNNGSLTKAQFGLIT